MNEKVVISGTSPAMLLGITFIILKLCGVIAWSWLWVLAPFWIPFALIAGVLAFCTLAAVAVAGLVKSWPKR